MADSNSPGFFTLVAPGPSYHGGEALHAFLELESEDVLAIVRWTLKRSPRGRTWQGLYHLMQQKGYARVRDMGEEAAAAWGKHLGVTAQAEGAEDGYEQSVSV